MLIIFKLAVLCRPTAKQFDNQHAAKKDIPHDFGGVQEAVSDVHFLMITKQSNEGPGNIVIGILLELSNLIFAQNNISPG